MERCPFETETQKYLFRLLGQLVQFLGGDDLHRSARQRRTYDQYPQSLMHAQNCHPQAQHRKRCNEVPWQTVPDCNDDERHRGD